MIKMIEVLDSIKTKLEVKFPEVKVTYKSGEAETRPFFYASINTVKESREQNYCRKRIYGVVIKYLSEVQSGYTSQIMDTVDSLSEIFTLDNLLKVKEGVCLELYGDIDISISEDGFTYSFQVVIDEDMDITNELPLIEELEFTKEMKIS